MTEAAVDSGSLITAGQAAEQGREVFAVPGPIYAPGSKGPNSLIKMGATAVTEAGDILEDLNLKSLPAQIDNQSLFGDNPVETKILSVMSKQPLQVDLIIKTSGLDAGEVTSALTFLEMKGKVKNLGGQQYIRSR